MHRTPKLKDQARLLREAYSQKGLTLSAGESLELVAKMNGYVSWNAACAAQPEKPKDTNRLIGVRLVTWTVVHHHNHGEDMFTVYSDDCPSDEEAVAIINSQGGGFDEQMDERFEVLGPDVKTLSLALGELEAKVIPTSAFESSVLRVFEVDMTEHFEYETPETVPAWVWIGANGSFSHRGNNKEPGVWEFIVNVETALENATVPKELKVFFERAKKANCVWVMFHQG